MAVRPSDLIPTGTYFMVTYPEASLTVPIVITCEYLGKDIHGPPKAGEESGYYFRYLPAFRYEVDGELDDAPVFFPEAKLAGIHDLAGLIRELNEVRERTQE